MSGTSQVETGAAVGISESPTLDSGGVEPAAAFEFVEVSGAEEAAKVDVVVDAVSSFEDSFGVKVAVEPATSNDGRVVPRGPPVSVIGTEEQLVEIAQVATRINTKVFRGPLSGTSNSSSEESTCPAEMHRRKDDGEPKCMAWRGQH